MWPLLPVGSWILFSLYAGAHLAPPPPASASHRGRAGRWFHRADVDPFLPPPTISSRPPIAPMPALDSAASSSTLNYPRSPPHGCAFMRLRTAAVLGE